MLWLPQGEKPPATETIIGEIGPDLERVLVPTLVRT
jgi:hypothetical protein